MDDLTDNNKYVSDRLKEAFRVSRMAAAPGFGNDLPVFPYLRPVYHYGARDFKMLNEVTSHLRCRCIRLHPNLAPRAVLVFSLERPGNEVDLHWTELHSLLAFIKSMVIHFYLSG